MKRSNICDNFGEEKSHISGVSSFSWIKTGQYQKLNCYLRGSFLHIDKVSQFKKFSSIGYYLVSVLFYEDKSGFILK